MNRLTCENVLMFPVVWHIVKCLAITNQKLEPKNVANDLSEMALVCLSRISKWDWEHSISS